jgi:PQQ-dependent catabolism-associated CXXCW motif protein
MRLIVLAGILGVLAQASASGDAGAAAPAVVTAPAEPEEFWNGPLNDPVPHTIKGGKVIHAQALAALLKGKDTVVVDVSNAPRRPESLPASTPWLPLPHRAIPGALWIPGAGLGAPPPPLDKYFRDRLAKATGNDMGKPLVLYCHQRCWLSWNGAKRAIQYGYRNVYWFPDGIEGWRKAKLPTTVIEPEATP